MNVHLDTLTIGGFRGIRDLHLEGLGAVNLLVGVNNAGKTSVLEALALCSSPLDASAWSQAARRRSIPSFRSGISRVDALKWVFPCRREPTSDGSPERDDLDIAVSGPKVTVHVAASYAESESPEPPEWAFATSLGKTRKQDRHGSLQKSLWLPAEGTYRCAIATVRLLAPASLDIVDGRPAALEERIDVWDDFSPRGRPRARRFFPCQYFTPYSHAIEGEPVRGISETVLRGKFEVRGQVVEMLRAFDPDIEGLELLAPRPQAELYVRHRHLGLTPLYTLGDGLRRALTMALAINRAHDGVLLVDEIETAIHTTVLTKLYQWLVRQCRENRVQLFTTTHSLEAIDTLVEAAQEETEMALTAFRLSQRDGHTEALRLEGQRLARLRFDLGQEVR